MKLSRKRKWVIRGLAISVACLILYISSFYVVRNRTLATEINEHDQFVTIRGYYFTTSDASNRFLYHFYSPLWHGLLRSKSSLEFNSMQEVIDYAEKNGDVYFYDSRYQLDDRYYWYEHFDIMPKDPRGNK